MEHLCHQYPASRHKHKETNPFCLVKELQSKLSSNVLQIVVGIENKCISTRWHWTGSIILSVLPLPCLEKYHLFHPIIHFTNICITTGYRSPPLPHLSCPPNRLPRIPSEMWVHVCLCTSLVALTLTFSMHTAYTA